MIYAALNDLDPLVDEAMQEWQIPGLAIAVVVHGEPAWLKAYGQRDVEAGLPVTTNTQFLLCSITKSFTAAGLGMLVDERRLDWAKPVREYIPEFRLYDPIATDRVTVQDLLSHHSGLPRHDWVWMPGDWSRAEMLAALRYLEPSRDIRANYQYSNLGYMVAGMVAERITGQSWEDFTRSRIMMPLGMTQVGFSSEDLERVEDSARPHVMTDDDERGVFVRKRAPLWPIRDTPAGGVNAAISDMANYLSFYLAGGRRNGAQLLSSAVLDAMQAPRVHSGRSEFEEIGDHHYGFGFGSHYYRGERVVGHSGGWIGWGTLMVTLPARRLGAVILTNRTPSPVTDILAFAISDRLCGRDAIPWLDRFRARRREGIAQIEVDRAAHRAARRPTAPSRPLAEYAGDYENPGYGRVSIEDAGDVLNWRFRGLSGELTHRHYDVFEVPENPAMLSPARLAVTFGYDREGNVNRLSAPLEVLVADIVFTRVAGGDVLDPGFRGCCVGTYQCGPTKHIVALDADEQITLSPTGQPTYRLVPYSHRTFKIENLEGYRVEFQRNEDGAVNTIVFHQPNGTFIGKRIGD